MSRTARPPRIDVETLVEGAYAATEDDAPGWADRLRNAAAEVADDHDRARLLLARAGLHVHDRAAELLSDAEEAAALFESVGDLERRAQCETIAAELCVALDDVGAAVTHAVAAVVAVDSGASDEVASDVLHRLGELWAGLFAFDEALRLYELSGSAGRRLRSAWRVERANVEIVEALVSWVRLDRLVGVEAWTEDRLVRAEGLARELASGADAVAYLVEGPRLLADVLCEQGRPEEAWLTLLAAPADGTDGYRLGRRLLVEARCLRLLGQPERAVANLERALADTHEAGDRAGALFVLDECAACRDAAGDGHGAAADARALAGLLWHSQQRRAGALAAGAVRAVRAELERRQVLRSAEQDPLTAVGNRLAFERRLDRSGDQTVVAVLVVDLDRFDEINDAHGRGIGDEVLARVAAVLRVEVRDRDLVARYGGDEFGVVLDGLDLRAAHAVAERIRRRVTEADWSDVGPGLGVTVSIGVAAGPGRDARRLHQRADVSLYEAKRAGRDRVVTIGG